MALSLMIYNKGSKIFSYKEMFRRIISYLIRHKKNHKKISSKWKANVIEYQNGVMATWWWFADFFFKISYNSWCYLTQVLTWHCNAISELWIGNDFKYFRYLSGWLITHSKHSFIVNVTNLQLGQCYQLRVFECQINHLLVFANY